MGRDTVTDMNDVVERIEGRIDRDVIGGVSLHKVGSGFAVVPTTLPEALELAKVLSTARGMIPAHLEANPGACADVVFQALQWGMNPFALAKMSFVAQRGGAPSYMSQAISAAINSSAQLDGRLRLAFDGDGDEMRCTVSGKFKGEESPHEYRSPRIRDITPKNSPLWKVDPQRQLGYWSQRAWARLYAGDILMGVYDADEITPDMLSKDVTPKINPFAGEGPKYPAVGGGGQNRSAVLADGTTATTSNPDSVSSLALSANSGAVEQTVPAPASYSDPATAGPSETSQDGAGALSSSSAPASLNSPELVAAWAGSQARKVGKSEDENPYEVGTRELHAWLQGYDKG